MQVIVYEITPGDLHPAVVDAMTGTRFDRVWAPTGARGVAGAGVDFWHNTCLPPADGADYIDCL